MIPTPRRILVARDPVDFRKSIDGLAAVCEVHLGEAPLDGTLFVFTNRRRKGIKMLVWTHGGFLMLYKKLEAGNAVRTGGVGYPAVTMGHHHHENVAGSAPPSRGTHRWHRLAGRRTTPSARARGRVAQSPPTPRRGVPPGPLQ